MICDEPKFEKCLRQYGRHLNGSVKKALISVGVEVGDKLVPAKYRSLEFTGKKIILNATKKQLDDRPEFDYREHGLFTSYHHRFFPYGIMPGPYGPYGGPMPPGHHRQWADEGDRIPRSGLQGHEGENQPYDRPYFRHHGTDMRSMQYRYNSWNRAYFPMQMLANIVLGQTVINKQGEDVATVEDLIVGAEGKVTALILSYGGFLGIDDKLVKVPYRPIGFTDVGITYDITRRELEKLPKFNNKK
jgi:sporulation protein YlmC with PRC-barrel domain